MPAKVLDELAPIVSVVEPAGPETLKV